MSGTISQNTYPEPPPCGSDVNTINIENVDHMTIRADQVIVSKPKKRLCRRRRRRRPQPEEDAEEDGDGDVDRYEEDEDEEQRPSRSKARYGRRRRGRGRERRVFTVMRVKKVRDSYGGEDTPVESSGDDEVVDYSGADDDDESGAVASAMVDAALSTGDFPWGPPPPPQGPCCRPGSGASSQHRGFGRFDRRESKEVQTIYPPAGASRSILRISTRRSGAVRPPYPPLQAGWTQTSNHAFQYYGGPPPCPPPQGPPTQSYRQEWPRASTYANEWSQTSQHRLPPPSPLNEARYTQTSNYALRQQMGGPPPNQLPPQGCCTGNPCINPVICPSTGTYSSPLPPSQPSYVRSQSQMRDQHARWGQASYAQPPLQLMDWTQTQNYANDWTQTSNYRLNQYGGAPPITRPSQQICCTGLPCRYPSICPGNAAASSASSTYPPFYQASSGSQRYQQGNQLPFTPRPQMEQTDWTQTSISNVASQRMQSSNYGLPPDVRQSGQVAVGDRRPELPFNYQASCQAQNRCCVCDQSRGPPVSLPAPDRGPPTPSAVELPQASFSFESSEEPRVRVQRSSTICRRSGRETCGDKGAVDAAARGASRALPAQLRVAERPDALLVQCRRGADAQMRVVGDDAPASTPDAQAATAPRGGLQLPSSSSAARNPGDPAPGVAPLFSRGINLNVTFPLSEVTGRSFYQNLPRGSPPAPRPIFGDLGGRLPLRGSLPRFSAENPDLLRRPLAPSTLSSPPAPQPLSSLLRSGAWALPRFSAQLDAPPRVAPRGTAHPPEQRQSQTRSPDFN